MSALHKIAQDYLQSGLSVVPAANKKSKINWHPFQQVAMTGGDVPTYFNGAPQIAIICGTVSGGLEIIDVDCKYDTSGELFDRYKFLIAQAMPNLLGKLVIAKTKSGGYHLIYRCPTIEGNKKLASRPATDGELEEHNATVDKKLSSVYDLPKVLIETRGEGGYFIAAPSEGYQLLSGSLLQVSLISPEERNVLWSSAKSLNEWVKPIFAKAALQTKETSSSSLSPGDDYDSRGDVVALLESHGWIVTGQIGETVRFKRPGESDSAYSANFNQIPGRFWCWSTSTVFEAEKPYKPYAVYAVLECDGDFKAAARKLYELGFGERTEWKKPDPIKESTSDASVEIEYFRVGTNYFKKISTMDLHGNQTESLKKWNRETLLMDHGKIFLSTIARYDTFISRPSHLNFRQFIGNAYNLYHRVSHVLAEGNFDNTIHFLQHVFGEKFDLFMDYLTILWRYPTQILPIICLVSEKRQTGKTTVLKWLRAVFQKNATILKNENFQTAFNAHYVTKLLIMIDENYVELDKKKEAERIKSMATADSEFLQMKGVDSEEIEFFGKILMTANNKEFIKIDREEIRYMVIEVPEFKKNDPDLLDKMIFEIPAMLTHLTNRQIIHPREDRAWFRPELLYTEALDEVVENTQNHYETLIDDFIDECLEHFTDGDCDTIYMSALDIYQELQSQYRFLDKVKVMRHLKALGMKAQKVQRYSFYSLTKRVNNDPTNPAYKFDRHGRPYVFKAVTKIALQPERPKKVG